MSFAIPPDPAFDPERRQRHEQLELPFSESARPDPDEPVEETEAAVKEALARIRKKEGSGGA